MSGHVAHTALPGFHPDQIWKDGCGLCEERASRPDHGITELDADRLRFAYARAKSWYREDGPVQQTFSNAERPLMQMLWGVFVSFHRAQLEIGE